MCVYVCVCVCVCVHVCVCVCVCVTYDVGMMELWCIIMKSFYVRCIYS